MTEGEINHLKGWVRARWDGVLLWEEPAQFFDASPECLWIGREAKKPGGDSAFESTVVAAGRGPVRIASDPPWMGKGARLRVAVSVAAAGRCLPLVTTGQIGQGDALFLKLRPGGAAELGYDHWGKPVIQSAPFPFTYGDEHVIEFWTPSLTQTYLETPLVVAIDGRTVWRRAVRAYPCTPFQVYPARNPLGATSCENTFEGAACVGLDYGAPQ